MAMFTCQLVLTSILVSSVAHGHTIRGRESTTKGAAWVEGLVKALQYMKHSSTDAPGWMADPKACAVAVENTLQVLADEYLDLHVGYTLSTACDHLNVHQDFGGPATCARIFEDLACHFDGDKDYATWCEQSGVALAGEDTGAGGSAESDACAEQAAECIDEANKELGKLKEKQAKGESPSKAELDHLDHMVGGDGKDVHVGDAHFGNGVSGPFGGAPKADELTKGSVTETDAMVDQIEKAQAAEEKRASYRALTRLRGVMTTSYDNIAHTHMDNIDKYHEQHKWRNENRVKHLAEEESDDVEKWASQR
eukprot:gnl/MRDRNA2_/MRDRNA2_123085_c0_seq1.p1 gnl/MRDRNA2_/MRDRNA2_123085_c0~~gnl/MRDRNA2_/MRDRNA2_123085_c0_seq1.p1  ORF type:complete len:309 (-),score=69.06 gnl/MRDRNA2_/MRDRNA2_123085_c0_seq1:52-978(-)